MSTVSPELVLVDPMLADREEIATRLDAWLVRTEWRPPAPPTSTWTRRRTALAAGFLASMLVNGVLTAFLLFGHHTGPTLQPVPATQPAAVANDTGAIDAPPRPTGP